MNGKARSAVRRALPICCVLMVIGCVLGTAQASGPDAALSASEVPKQNCPRPPDRTKFPVAVKQPDPRSLHVNVTCEVPSQPLQPVVVPIPTPSHVTPRIIDADNSVKPALDAADIPAEVRAIVLAERLVLGLILFIAVWFAFLGARLMGSKGLVAATDAFLFRRHWGGFGGESSGWNLSAPAGKCAAGLLLIALSAGLAAGMLVVLHAHTQPDSNAGTQQPSPQKPQGKDAGAPASAPGKLTAAAPDSPG
jgi:hypothetical protein